MGKTRSMARKKKHDDAIMNRHWSDLNHDVLFSVMMRLTGVVDFAAFSGVCKPWRSLALINRNKFIVSRPPMTISFSTDSKKCYLEDFEGRKFSTILPCSGGRTCHGVTCGYLIMSSRKRRNIWLVNPITRHELCFPNVPRGVFCCPGYEHSYLRGILVFSPAISGWVFVVLNFCSPNLFFSIAGTREWSSIYKDFSYAGLHAFNGKIYTWEYKDFHRICPLDKLCVHELRLHPEPKLVLVKTDLLQKPDFTDPKFVTSGENLYVIDKDSKLPYMNIHELDFGKMKWVSCENSGEKYAFFSKKFDFATITLREVWADLRSRYERHVFTDKIGKERMLEANMWYFFHDCLNAKKTHES